MQWNTRMRYKHTSKKKKISPVYFTNTAIVALYHTSKVQHSPLTRIAPCGGKK